MIANARFHCGRDSQARMNPNKIVVHEVDRQRMTVILNLFAMRVS